MFINFKQSPNLSMSALKFFRTSFSSCCILIFSCLNLSISFSCSGVRTSLSDSFFCFSSCFSLLFNISTCFSNSLSFCSHLSCAFALSSNTFKNGLSNFPLVLRLIRSWFPVRNSHAFKRKFRLSLNILLIIKPRRFVFWT